MLFFSRILLSHSTYTFEVGKNEEANERIQKKGEFCLSFSSYIHVCTSLYTINDV